MRVLYVGNSGGIKNAGLFYLFPPRLINGLTREGHNVHVFNDRDIARNSNIFKSSRLGIKKTNEALIQTCRNFMPHLIIIAHCENISNNTLDEIRTICDGVKIIHRNVDPLSSEFNVSRIKNRINHVDGIFITTAGDALKQFTSNKTFSAFLPNPVDLSIDTGKAFSATTYDADLFFAAGAMRENDHRTILISDLLKKTATIKSEIIGAGINKKSLFGLPYMNKLASVKMGLVINKTEDFYLYASDRMSQYMGNGIMVFANEKPQYSDIFADTELVTYTAAEDLADKVNYYATHDSERRRIAENGYHRAHQIFNTQLIARYIINTTFDMPVENTAWPSQKYTA